MGKVFFAKSGARWQVLGVTVEIVIPCFREEVRLPPFLRDLASEMEEREIAGGITVVDDGSGPASARALSEAVEELRRQHPERIRAPFQLPANEGKGGAVRSGWDHVISESHPDFLAFVDADGATSAGEFCRLIQLLEERKASVDAIWGSRIRMLGRRVERKLSRHLTGRLFSTMTHWNTGLQVYDSQCGAKVMKREVYLSIRDRLEESGFAFDIELALLSLQEGYGVVEEPVSWSDTDDSRVHLLRDGARMFFSLLRIRKRHGRIPPGE